MRTSTLLHASACLSVCSRSQLPVRASPNHSLDDRRGLLALYSLEHDFLASIPAFLSKPVWGILIDRYSPKKLAAIGAALTGGAVVVIVYSVATRFDALVYSGFIMMGFGWGGSLPLQEVIWATTFGRRYLWARFARLRSRLFSVWRRWVPCWSRITTTKSATMISHWLRLRCAIWGRR